MQPIFLLAQIPVLLISVWMTMIVERLLSTRSLGYESIQYFVWFACIFVSVEYLALSIVNVSVKPRFQRDLNHINHLSFV